MDSFMLSLQGYLLQVRKLERKYITAEFSFSSSLMFSKLYTTILFKKLLKDSRWLKETGTFHRAKVVTEEKPVIHATSALATHF